MANEHPGALRLKELVDGLGGVTPGPWEPQPFVDNRPMGSGHHTYKIAPQRGVYGSLFEADAKHLSRCNPNAIREIAGYAEVLEAENARLREALTPSERTKYTHMGEYRVPCCWQDEDGNEHAELIDVPWVTIKEIMRAILDSAALASTEKDGSYGPAR